MDPPEGDVIVFDGTTGVYKRKLVQPTPDLANVVGIVVGPTGDFYVSASNDVAASNVSSLNVLLLLFYLICYFFLLIFLGFFSFVISSC